jgi:hypothetical protein
MPLIPTEQAPQYVGERSHHDGAGLLSSSATISDKGGKGNWAGDEDDPGPLLPARAVCARYQIVDRTLDRWLHNPALNFPRPLLINGRRYFRERLLGQWERSRASGKEAA